MEKENIDSNNSGCPCHKNVEWLLWDSDYKSDSIEILEDKLDIFFKRKSGCATSVIRCKKPMINDQYYWEIKMTGEVYAIDIMIGVGTPDTNFNNVDNKFLSFLGMDDKTWGYSYLGLFQHDGIKRCYGGGKCFGGEKFREGDIIGVHLDLWKGTLTFYKNRKNLGIACSGLKGKILHAMVASTAYRSQMRMVYSSSFPSSLQFLCCAKLREIVPDNQNVLDALNNIPPGMKRYLSSNLSWLLDKRKIVRCNNHCCRVVEPAQDDFCYMERYLLARYSFRGRIPRHLDKKNCWNRWKKEL